MSLIRFDTELERQIEKGINSPVSLLRHKEIFKTFRAQYTQLKSEKKIKSIDNNIRIK
jgi:hypothetical protein